MGTDDLFKKRRAARQQRNHEYKNPLNTIPELLCTC